MRRFLDVLQSRDFLIGAILALIVTIVINAPLWHALLTTDEWRWDDIVQESSDEFFYLARIREVADGHPAIGHPIFFDRRDQFYPLGTLWEKIASVPLVAFGWRIKTVSIVLDFVASLLLSLFLWFGIRPIVRSRQWRMVLIALVFLGSNISVWKRPISPQLTTILPLFYFWLFFGKNALSPKWSAFRGALIGLMLFSYPFHWTFCLAAEFLLQCRAAVINRENIRSLIVRFAWLIVPLGIFVVPWTTTLLHALPDPAYHETMARLGLIERRLPAAPVLQLTILAAAGLFWIASRVGKVTINDRLMILLVAGLFVLWQPMLTRREAEFSSHYAGIIGIVVSIALVASLERIVESQPRWSWPILGACALLIGISTVQATQEGFDEFRSSRLPVEARQARQEQVELVQTLPSESVIFVAQSTTPLLLLETDHYPYTSYDAYMYMAPDAEVRKRAEVYNTLVPGDSIGVRGVIGTKMENRRLYERTICRLRGVLFSDTECSEDIDCPECTAIIDPPKRPSRELAEALDEAKVRYVFLPTLPDALKMWTKEIGSAGGLTLYEFTFRR